MWASYKYFDVVLKIGYFFARFKTYCTVLSTFWHDWACLWLNWNLTWILYDKIYLMRWCVCNNHSLDYLRRSILAVCKTNLVWSNGATFLYNFSYTCDSLNFFINEKFYLFFYHSTTLFCGYLIITFYYCFSTYLFRRLFIKNT